MMNKKLYRRVQTAIAAGAICLVAAMAAQAQEKKGSQGPSDRTVDFLKTFVEGFLLPKEIPLKDGSVIKIDLSNAEQLKKFQIPREDMRRVIRIAYNGANAEICDREDLQRTAYKWMKDQELAKKKWSNEQLFFISRLYIATVMWQTGKAQVTVEEEDGKPVNAAGGSTAINAEPPVCTDSKRASVEKFEAFLKAQIKKKS